VRDGPGQVADGDLDYAQVRQVFDRGRDSSGEVVCVERDARYVDIRCNQLAAQTLPVVLARIGVPCEVPRDADG